jgi:alpha-tubulin suppressor-like RCC1 family protein
MGANDNGQLGDGTNHYKTTPVPVYTAGVLRGKSIIKLSGHSETITALTKDQKVISWGCGANGRLGNGNVRDSNVPVLVKTDGALKGKIVVDIAGAAWSTSCLTSDNKLFSWGYNVFGALGDGTFTDSAVPVPVNDLYNYLAGKTIIGIHPGYFYTLIQTSDYLYGYGHNQYSQLGDGTSQYSYSYIVRVDAANKLAGLNVTSVHCGHHNIVTAENGSAPFYQPLRVVRSSGLGLFENKSITVVKAILLIAFVQYLIQG